MSRSSKDGVRGGAHRGRPGFEFWSGRPYYGEGKDGKSRTHRTERRLAKHQIRTVEAVLRDT